MKENIVLLRHFILETPAPASEHEKQEARLKSIIDGYTTHIKKLEKELQKERDTNDWLRDENEQLQQQLNEQTNETEHTSAPKTTYTAEDRADAEESGLQ